MRSRVDLKKIRSESLLRTRKLGYQTNLSLPLLDQSMSLRPIDEIVNRSLVLFAIVACSYGFDRMSALRWIEQERLLDCLANSERKYLRFCEGDVTNFQSQVECLNAFAWVLGLVRSIPFDSVCDNTLIRRFPNIKNNGNSDKFRQKAKLRSFQQVISVCDLAY